MVHSIARAAVLLSCLSPAVLAFRPSHGYGWNSVGKAIYFISNDADNAVVALPIKSDGTVSMGSKTPTGGEGSNIATNGTSMRQAPDSLGSQGSVTAVGEVCLAVHRDGSSELMKCCSTSSR